MIGRVPRAEKCKRCDAACAAAKQKGRFNNAFSQEMRVAERDACGRDAIDGEC